MAKTAGAAFIACLFAECGAEGALGALRGDGRLAQDSGDAIGAGAVGPVLVERLASRMTA